MKISIAGLLYLIGERFFKKYKTFRYIRRQFPTATIDHNVDFLGDIKNVHLGKNIVFQANSTIDIGGTTEWCDYKGYLEIGDDSFIAQNCIIYAAGPFGVKIGKRLDCGPGVCIFSSRTNYEIGVNHHVFGPVEIGDDVIIYSNVVISPNVRIGNGSAIAAGAVVTQDVPENTLVGGVPARIIKRIRKMPQSPGLNTIND